jgi:hypothetical protein
VQSSKRAQVPVDQAAGLRRRNRQQLPHCIHCFVDTAESTLNLARALHQQGQRCLLVDGQGRMFTDASTRSLFDWKTQVARGQLNTLPLAFGEAWVAPGVRAAEPGLRHLAQSYDLILFDCAPETAELDAMPDARITLVADVHADAPAMQHVYARLKTLSAMAEVVGVHLQGDPLACRQVRAACCHFLSPEFAHGIHCTAGEPARTAGAIDANNVLAVRMASGGTGATTRNKTDSS